jgi:hypothetical protein
MSQAPSQSLDLANLIGSVLPALTSNQSKLNTLDGHNGNHGDNMVQIFEVASKALGAMKDKPADKAFLHAAKKVRSIPSGSAQAYAQGFDRAAETFSGRSALNAKDGMGLLGALLGNAQGAQKSAPAPEENPLGDLLGSLLSGGGAQPGQAQSEPDLANMLLKGGLAFLQAKQEGDDTLTAGLEALLSSTAMGQSAHRKQSTSLVMEGLLSALPQLLG